MIDVIVIGQNYSTSLGLIKAIAREGYHCALARCIAGNDRFPTPDIRSRYTQEYVYLPRNDDESVIDGLISKWGNSDKKKALIPADDYCASLIDKNSASLSPFFVFPYSSQDNGILFFMNKEEQKRIVAKSGILTSKCKRVSIQKMIHEQDFSDISFPCMVKPIMSLGTFKSWIQCCQNIEELFSLIGLIKKSDKCPTELLIEEYIEIESEFTIPCLALDHRVYIPAFIEKVVIAEGKHKGVTICGKVIDAERFSFFRNSLVEAIKGFGVFGLLDIEVFYSKGNFYLNEVNFRNGAAGYSLTRSGINLPLHLVDFLLNGILPDTSRWRIKPTSFVNDKANIESYSSRQLTFRQYRKNIKESDIRLVAEKDDLPACRAFKLIEIVSVLKHFF